MDEIIIFDTETTTDPTQRFLFGSFRYVVRYQGKLSTIAEGLVYADDLIEYDPDGYNELVRYVDKHNAHVDYQFMGPREPSWKLYLISRSQFVERWIWRIGYQREATIVGFNLPFDLSRIALDVTDARKPFTDGFSFALYKYDLRPRLRIKHVSSTKSFIGWTYGNVPDGTGFRGNFVDLRTATFALTNRKHSLQTACEAFNCPIGKVAAEGHGTISESYIDYNRNDVGATLSLYAAVLEEFERHPLGTTLAKIYSPASIAKAYYRAMGMTPPLERFTVNDELMGNVMSAFYGGRAECTIRRQSVPVSVLDFTSMYPTVNALMKLWFLLTARDVTTEDATDDVQSMLDHIAIDDCFEQGTWRNFVGIAKVKPNGDILPVRAKYGPDASYNIGINEVTSDTEMWYALPDLVASKLLTGKAPEITEAIRFVPHGTDHRLRSVRLRGEALIEPRSQDFFTWVIEKRAEVKDSPLGDFLKVLANSGSYGIFAEMNRDDGTEETDVGVWSAGVTWNTRVRHPERPGRYAYPPVAACITAAARLMLAMLERLVTDAGGCWAFCDTDSMAVVSAEPGGWFDVDIKSIPPRKVDQIIERFDALSPYRQDIIPHLLKLEKHGQCYSVSAKRYAITDHMNIPVDWKEHGLGHLMGPYHGWTQEAWQALLQNYRPAWFDLPALSRWTVTTPALYHRLRVWNEGKSYQDRVKPFNFVSALYVEKQHKPIKGQFQLIGPYVHLPELAPLQKWINQYDPESSYDISTMAEIFTETVKVKTYGEVLADYLLHPESKFRDRNGEPCGPHTTGRLYRTKLILAGTDYIGKESNKVEQVVQGELALIDTQLKVSQEDIRWDQMHDRVFDVLSRYRDSENARLVGISAREYRNLKAGTHRPNNVTRTKIVKMAVTIACADIQRNPNLVKDARSLLTEWKVSSNRSSVDVG